MTHGKTYNKSPRRINHKATKSKSKSRTLSFRFTSLNVITSLNATIMSSQYGGRQQSKWLFYQIIILEMKGVPEKESLMGLRSIQKNPSLAITVCITRQASWCQTVILETSFFCLPLTSVIAPYSMTWKLNRKQSGQPYSTRSQR